MTIEFEVTTRISAAQETAFDLSLDIDAHRASMGASKERAVAGVTTGRIGLGEEVTWRATHFGIPFRMTSRVTELERPHRFVDQQTGGPFRRFHHEHRFDVEDGETVMVDHVQFDAPLGPIGRLVERAILGRYLKALIETRGAFLKAEAEKRAGSEAAGIEPFADEAAGGYDVDELIARRGDRTPPHLATWLSD
jgi:ligand-binding SRPBCC domain-containing protein